MQTSDSNTEVVTRRGLPAWLLSLTLHATVLTAIGLTLRFTPRGAAVEPDREVGISIVHQRDGQREYFDGEEDSEQNEAESAAAQSANLPVQEAVEPIDLAGILPSLDEPLVGDANDALPNAEEMTKGASAGRVGSEGSAQTEVFGITGEGNRFVYVFDRSGSMEGYGGRPLAAAKAELMASLEDLEEIHQFQIIFYNNDPTIFNATGGIPKLLYADVNGTRAAQRFVQNISASGGTHHMSALRLALGMSPDVVFFLTDADEPQLSPAELRQVHRMNSSAAIHCIEFGFGPQANRNNFLVQLARQNGGQHAYVDISRLGLPKSR